MAQSALFILFRVVCCCLRRFFLPFLLLPALRLLSYLPFCLFMAGSCCCTYICSVLTQISFSTFCSFYFLPFASTTWLDERGSLSRRGDIILYSDLNYTHPLHIFSCLMPPATCSQLASSTYDDEVFFLFPFARLLYKMLTGAVI